MWNEPGKSYRFYDANISIWNRTISDPVMNRDMETYEVIRALLVPASLTPIPFNYEEPR